MKKYVKPEMFFDQFELSQHIADCMLEYTESSNQQAAETCVAFTDPDLWGSSFPVFIEINTSCVEKIEEYCYTGGTNGMNTFTS